MQLVIEQEALAEALALPMRCISKKAPMPICTKVALRAEGGTLGTRSTLTLIGTDTIRRSEVLVDASEVLEPGGCCVEAQTFAAIARKLPKGPVSLKVEKYALTIKAGRTRSTLPIVPIDDFPPLDNAGPGAWSSVSAEALREVLAARYCMLTDETRAHMAGVHLATVGGKVVAQTSDGHRGARFEADDPEAKFAPFLLPLVALHDVLALVESASGRVEIACGGGGARWRAATSTGAITLAHKLPDDQFPPLDQVVSRAIEGAPNTAKVDREATAAAVSRCKITTIEKSEGLVISFVGDELHLKSDSPDRGTTQDGVPIIGSATDTKAPIGLMASYLRETLDAHVADEVELSVGDELAAVLVRSPGRVSIIMPMRA